MNSSSLYNYIIKHATLAVATSTQAIMPKGEAVSPMNEDYGSDVSIRKIECGVTRCKVQNDGAEVPWHIERCI